MSDDKLGPARRPRPLSRPQLPPGPLRELKDLLYELYAQAGCPTLDQITEGIRGDDSLAGAPQRDTIRRVLSSPELPASQHDAVAVATVLARAAGWDAGDTASRARQAWVAARLALPLGRPLREITDPFGLEVHRCIDGGTAGLPVLPPYVQREHDKQLEQVLKAVTKEQVSRIVVLVGGSSTGKTRTCWEAIDALRKEKEEWRLWHPLTPDRPESLLEGLPRLGPRTVVWLNDAQHYLRTPASPLGEQVAAALRDLLRDPSRGPVLILGTIWPPYWHTLTTPPRPEHQQRRPARPGPGLADRHRHSNPGRLHRHGPGRAECHLGRDRRPAAGPGRRACRAGTGLPVPGRRPRAA